MESLLLFLVTQASVAKVGEMTKRLESLTRELTCKAEEVERMGDELEATKGQLQETKAERDRTSALVLQLEEDRVDSGFSWPRAKLVTPFSRRWRKTNAIDRMELCKRRRSNSLY